MSTRTPSPGIDLVAGDGRAGRDFAALGLHAEAAQRLDDEREIAVELVFAQAGVARLAGGRAEQLQRGQHVIGIGDRGAVGRERGIALLRGGARRARRRLGRGSWATLTAGRVVGFVVFLGTANVELGRGSGSRALRPADRVPARPFLLSSSICLLDALLLRLELLLRRGLGEPLLLAADLPLAIEREGVERGDAPG